MKSHFLSFLLLWDSVSNNGLFSFSLSLSVVFPLNRTSNGVWDLSSCWNQSKSLIHFLKETIHLKYKFILQKPTFCRLLSFFSLLFGLRSRKLFLRFLSFIFFSVCAIFEFPSWILNVIQNPSGGFKFFSFLFFSFWLSSLLWIPFRNSERNTKSFKWTSFLILGSIWVEE